MEQTQGPEKSGIGGGALLAAYQLLIETTAEPGDDDVLLQRALAVIAAIRWPVPHRFFSAYLTAADPPALHLAAVSAGAAASTPPCPAPAPGSCLCGRALTHPGRLLSLDPASGGGPAPCDPAGSGRHLILPLVARGRTLGVIHALLEPGATGGVELAFLVQVATLLGAELQRRRDEREHDRLEMQFLQAQKMEAVGRLAGGVAHDFNNILTAITSYADLGLLKLPEDSPLRRNFNEILAAADRATLLTQQLLAFSRRQTHAPRVIDLNAVVFELAKTLRRLLGSSFDLSIQTEKTPARIVADPALIEQLVINLMINARDAMPRGGAVILSVARTSTAAALGPGSPATERQQYVELSLLIRDGLSPEALLSLCRPGTAAGEPATGGTLGPAAVHDIVRECGGLVKAEATADGGSVLCFSFPAATAAATQQPAATSQLPGGSETVLLVEDDDSVRVVMAEILRDLGYQLLEAREGREALALAAGHQSRIDVLLADLELRGFGGNELWRRLSATRPGLRVLHISGVMDDLTASLGTVSLPKPFSPWALALRLRQVLDAPSPGVAGP